MTAEENAKSIAENEARILELEAVVLGNKSRAYDHRSLIEENRMMLLSNYTAAFAGNRQLANMNTDAIFSNRIAFLRTLSPENDVQTNFVNSQINKARLDALVHRAALNSKVIEISARMAEINAQLIDVNRALCKLTKKLLPSTARSLRQTRR